MAKRVEVLRELRPSMTAAALLAGPSPFGGGRQGAITAAQALGLRLEVFDWRDPAELEPIFQRAAELRVEGMVVGVEALNANNKAPIISLCAKHRIAAVHSFTEARDGALCSLSVNSDGILRRSGKFVDQILKGANPAELPIELWTGNDLIVNLRTAAAIGFDVPASLVSRATEVIR